MLSLSTQLVPLSSSSSNPRWTYDVFPNFHGKDIRNSFRSHLLAALSRKGIAAFTDDEKLERGEDLDEGLYKVIKESQCAVVIFSKNYAFSKWCLKELAMIVECKKAEIPRMVLPIFYHVEPCDVRNQLGTFADAFARHIENPKVDKKEIKTWRVALEEVGQLAGWHVHDRPEAEVVEEISQCLLFKLSRNSSIICKGLVGIKFPIEEVLTLLCIGGDDVRYVGICGMGGIGKTTIAKEVYNTISSQYQASCLIVHGSEEAGNPSLVYLQKQLLSELLNDNKIDVWNHLGGINLIENRLANKKVFIVLDNVDQEIQIKALVGKHEWFGPGSRILVTSRDYHLLAQYVNCVYQVKELGNNEALQLFSWKAFQKPFPDEEFLEISRDIVDHAKGLPLAIEVFASSLCGEKSIDFWRSARDQFKGNLNSNILQKLKLSFDGLEYIQKQLFLDVACCFNGRCLDDILPILESFGYHPNYNIGVLIGRSLIKISQLGYLNMHDVLVQVGRQIVDQESLKEPGGRSRLWRHDDIINILQNNDDVAAIEAICLILSHELWHKVQIQVSLEAFSNMKRLRMLEITPNSEYHLLSKACTIKWLGDPSKIILTNKLCYMNWFQYPLKSLPTTFQPNYLVKLILRYSHVEKLWDGRKRFQKLLLIDLSYSENLLETPDFTEVPNLEELLLSSCKRLAKVHQSVGYLKQLKQLNLRFCGNLQTLPDEIRLESLEVLDLSYCSRVKKFPSIMGNMLSLTQLILSGIKMETLPSSIMSLSSLKTLHLLSCDRLKEIPQSLGGMESLETFILTATTIRELPSSVVFLKKLKTLYIDGGFSNLVSFLLPKSFSGLNSLTVLSLTNCNLFDEAIPSDLCSLLALEALYLDGNKLTKIPQCVYELPNLTGLSLAYNKSLKAPELFLPSLTNLNLSYCNLSDGMILNDFNLSNLDLLCLLGNKFTKIPNSITQLTKLRSLDLRENSSLRMLPKLPLCLQGVAFTNCPLLDTFYMDMWTSNEMLWTSDSTIQAIYFGYDGKSYKILQLHPKSPLWIDKPSLHGLVRATTVAWGPSRGYAIPRWFKQRSNSSSVKVQICKDVCKKLEGFALFIVYEVHEADPFERRRKVKKLDKHENSSYRGFYRRNPTFPEIVCRLQFDEDHPPRRVVFVLRAPYVTPDGLHGVWLVIPVPKFSELGEHLDRGSGVEASIALSSRNVQIKECGVSLVNQHDVTECCEVLSGLSPHGFGSTMLENFFSLSWALLVPGGIKEGYLKEFPRRRIVKAAARRC